MNPKLEEIRKKAIPVLKRHGIVHAAISGSFTRGELRKGSDLDMLVESGGRKTLLDLVRVERRLSEILDMEVDLLTKGAISPLSQG